MYATTSSFNIFHYYTVKNGEIIKKGINSVSDTWTVSGCSKCFTDHEDHHTKAIRKKLQGLILYDHANYMISIIWRDLFKNN